MSEKFVLRRRPHVQDKGIVRFRLTMDRCFTAKFVDGWWIGETNDFDVAYSAERRGWEIVEKISAKKPKSSPAPAPDASPKPEPEPADDSVDFSRLLNGTVKNIDSEIDLGLWDPHLVEIFEAEKAGKNRKGVVQSISIRLRRIEAGIE